MTWQVPIKASRPLHQSYWLLVTPPPKPSDRLGATNKVRLVIPCVDDSAIRGFLNTPEVREAIHTDIPEVKTWEVCSDEVNKNYRRTYTDLTEQYSKIIQSKVCLFVCPSPPLREVRNEQKALVYLTDILLHSASGPFCVYFCSLNVFTILRNISINSKIRWWLFKSWSYLHHIVHLAVLLTYKISWNFVDNSTLIGAHEVTSFSSISKYMLVFYSIVPHADTHWTSVTKLCFFCSLCL